MNTLDKVGCFFHCFRDREATVAVLRHFRRWYPDSTIHLISDGGLDFSDVAAEYGCRYWHEQNIGIQIQTGKATMHEWIRRVERTCLESPEEWMLVLEDDLLIRGPLNEPPWPMAGSNAGHKLYRREIGRYVIGIHPHLKNQGYGGGGGTVFRRSVILEAVERYFRLENFDRWRAMAGYVASDIWLTTMVMAAGYQYGPNPDLTETNRDLAWRDSQRPILHQPPREMLCDKSGLSSTRQQ